MTRETLAILLAVAGPLLLAWVLWPGGKPSVAPRNFDRISRSVLAGFVAILGIALLVGAFVWRIPKSTELVERREHLLSFYVLHQSNGPFRGESKTWYDIVWYTSEGGTYFSESLNEHVAAEALEHPGAVVQFYMKPNQTAYTLENGEHARPTYGLSVDDVEIQSVASALAQERGWVRIGWPLLGLGMIGLGLFEIRRNMRETPSPNQSLQPTAGRSDV